ncbi:Gfo/Idh/MocA family oxidoreductase [Peribacillus frigoritolerans]|uniref:Gfo/Idh/MocA family oxidoreductase n=1 Tax=Peribacillus frigoritolerans TaxID=450367 RepID=UPI003D34F76F
MNMIKIGIVGVGSMGLHHCRILNMMKGVEFIGVFDKHQERCKEVANQFHVQSFSSFKEMIKQVDAVIIAAPTAVHYQLLINAIQHGKHVLVEKPLVTDIKDAKQIKHLIADKNLIVQVGHVERFNPAVQQLQKIIEKRNIITIEAKRLGSVQRTVDVDVIFDLMIHDIDIILDIVDSPIEQISASGVALQSDANLDVATALLKFRNGVIANLTANRISQEKIRVLSITETDRLIKANYLTKELFIFRKISSSAESNLSYRQESIVEKIIVPFAEPLYEEILHFVQSIQLNQNPKVGVNEATHALEVASKIKDCINEK